MSRTYEQLEPVITALDERIKTNLGAFPTDTASGAVASFADGADGIPLKSLVVDINPVQSGSGDPSPENICPISGWTGMTVNASGKNLLPPVNSTTNNGVTFTVNADGSITINGTANGNASIVLSEDINLLKPDTTYKINGSSSNSSRTTYRLQINLNNQTTAFTAGGQDVQFTTPSNITRLQCYIVVLDGVTVSNATFYPMIRLASIADATYEPYSGQTIPISWQTETGTVYGGSLDVLSGVLTVDRAMVDLGTLTWDYRTTGYTAKPFLASLENALLPKISSVIVPALCSRYLQVPPNQMNVTGRDLVYAIGYYFDGQKELQILDSNYTDAQTFKTAMDGVQLVYELATPIEIQLTPHGVNSLYGQNSIFADTGDTSVEYRADTKLYIERLTEPDADMVADANITSGQYFMVGNSLYLATSNIASGGQVIVGTNCTQKSLATALNEINQ